MKFFGRVEQVTSHSQLDFVLIQIQIQELLLLWDSEITRILSW